MTNTLVLVAATGAFLYPISDKSHHLCIPLSQPKALVEKVGGVWEPLSPSQWQFLRGIYVMNPATPAGLPLGNGAVLVSKPGSPDGMVFFIDGINACDPMGAPKVLIEDLVKVKNKVVDHEGDGL